MHEDQVTVRGCEVTLSQLAVRGGATGCYFINKRECTAKHCCSAYRGRALIEQCLAE